VLVVTEASRTLWPITVEMATEYIRNLQRELAQMECKLNELRMQEYDRNRRTNDNTFDWYENSCMISDFARHYSCGAIFPPYPDQEMRRII
jgi:hypothetical protein